MRRSPRWVVFAIIVVACGQAAISSTEGGDGILDCEQGRVTRGAGIEVRGATEEEVVEEALREWKSQGAALLEFPEAEVWSAVLDGRDVAVAVVEQNGDGTWVSHDVSVCGEPETGPAPIDGKLDCANGYRWVMQAGIDPSVTGQPTPEEALRSALEPLVSRYGGEIAFVDDDTASIVVHGREQVTADAAEVPEGGWAVSSVEGCEGFEP
ncbi:MAG: hypothetical protein ACE5F5_07240 [Acidimicrobiia bacterium]